MEIKGTTRREFLRTTLFMGTGVLALGGYASVIEPSRVVIKQLELKFPRLPEAFDGLRIALISDIHFQQFLGADHVRVVVNDINRIRPDIVAVTGDFVSSPFHHGPRQKLHAAERAYPCAAVLENIQAPLGRYAVLGNHDSETSPSIVTEALQQRNTPVLQNRALPIERNGSRIWIAGMDDACVHKTDIAKALALVPKNEFTVGLIHEPDVADELSRHPVDLQLSGHSHGGQVRVPGMGPIILPPLGRKYPLGLYTIGNLKLYTNPGIGVVGMPVRFYCPPELTVFTLRRNA